MFYLSNIMKILFSSLNVTFARALSLYKSRSFYTLNNVDTNTQGIFLIIRIDLKHNPTTLFMFYNTKIKKITYYKIYFGPSYYKNFTKYILDVLKETKFKGEVINILAPKYFINK